MSTQVELKVNGRAYPVASDPPRHLLGVLRDELELSGTKYGCGEGECGACTVLVDGRAVRSCQTPVAECAGKAITTIEGIARQSHLHPIQQCFLEDAALQCGVCTPGFIMSAKALLDRNPNPSEHEIRFQLSGNLCRCTGYDKIVRAVQHSAELLKKEPSAVVAK